MTDGIPQVILGIDEASQSVVIVEGQKQVGSLAALVAEAPGLLHPEAATTMARVVAHFAAGTDYRVIEDPAGYEASFRAQVAGEDPGAPWRAGVYRLRDHGMPDFAAITVPAFQGTKLIFFAYSAPIPLPYRVELDVADPGVALGPDIFRAVSLTPFPPSGEIPAPNPQFVGATGTPVTITAADRAARKAKPPLVVEDVGDDDAPEE